MNLDNIDLDMMLYFLENGNSTHTTNDVVKELYPNAKRDEIINKNNMIRHRLQKLCKEGYFTSEEIDRITHYTINLEGVYYEDNVVLRTAVDEIGTGRALIFRYLDDTYLVYFLDE